MGWRDRRIGFLSDLVGRPDALLRLWQRDRFKRERAQTVAWKGRPVRTRRQKRLRVRAMAGRRQNVQRLIRARR